jgi:hypothetical protein
MSLDEAYARNEQKRLDASKKVKDIREYLQSIRIMAAKIIKENNKFIKPITDQSSLFKNNGWETIMSWHYTPPTTQEDVANLAMKTRAVANHLLELSDHELLELNTRGFLEKSVLVNMKKVVGGNDFSNLKWLAIAAAVIVLLLVVLWLASGSSESFVKRAASSAIDQVKRLVPKM